MLPNETEAVLLSQPMVLVDAMSGPGAGRATGGGALEDRVIAAGLRCIARWGVTKTTLDDIAREAGCSRATVYRLFPGGKSSLVQTVGEREVGRLLIELLEVLDRTDDLEELFVVAIGTAAAFIRDNEALQTVTRHEPDQLLPYLAFDRLGPLLEATSTFLGPVFARHLDRRSADEVVEWAARLVLSYTFTPSTTIDLTNDLDVRRLVTTHLLPGIARATDPVS